MNLALFDLDNTLLTGDSDFEWAEKWAETCSVDCALLLQPEWDKREKMMPKIIDYVKENPRWRICIQTHKVINVP